MSNNYKNNQVNITIVLMKKKYDVIIIGAGPAGLKCAEGLKDSKLSVLIIEKNKIIGPKVCGGGLTGLVNPKDLPKNKIRVFNSQKTFLNDEKYDIKFVVPLKTLDRFDLGQYQLKKIKNAKNITILKGVFVRSIHEKKIFTDKGIFYYNYLVGADGSSSIVRRYLGLKSKFCVGFMTKIYDISNEFTWIFNPKNLKSGYIWIFPHLNYTNIGVYFDPKIISPKKAKKFLIEHLTNLGYEILEKDLHGASINYAYDGISFGNIFLIGDAAGLTSKIWGEGIPYALLSGEEVAKKILNPTHSMKNLKLSIKIKKRQETIGKLFELFPPMQHFLIKFFVSLMGGNWFQYYFGIALSSPSAIKESKILPKRDKSVQSLDIISKWVRYR